MYMKAAPCAMAYISRIGNKKKAKERKVEYEDDVGNIFRDNEIERKRFDIWRILFIRIDWPKLLRMWVHIYTEHTPMMAWSRILRV